MVEADYSTHREHGNQLFKKANYQDALDHYLQSVYLAADDTDSESLSQLYLNISICYLKLHSFDEAITSASKSIDLHKSIKGYFRLAKSYEAIKDYV